MYWEWVTLTSSSGVTGGDFFGGERSSVLGTLPPEAAKDVVTAVVRPLVATLGISQAPSASPFEKEEEVEWALQVICYGLSLPFTEHELVKDCVSIYCEWLSCLSPIPKISVPKPLTERKDYYARKIINQLYHLFVPRKGEGQDTINRQSLLCHRVLRVLENAIKGSESVLEPATWECVLLFLISINEAMLSPPGDLEGDIGDQLGERVLSVLFEVWLLACGKSFPSPSMWKTLREACLKWRHRPFLFQQWNRVNLIMTKRVIKGMYGDEYFSTSLSEGEDGSLSLLPGSSMDEDCVVQTWYRFLHTLGNPVDLTQPTIISQTQHFLQYAIASEAVVDPCQHPCLSVLPSIFHQAMRGIAAIVDAFLGLPPQDILQPSTLCAKETEQETTSISPVAPVRRLAKSFSVATSSNPQKGQGHHRTSLLGISTGRSKDTSSIPSSTSSLQQQQSNSNSGPGSLNKGQGQGQAMTPAIIMAPGRPKVNSLLHLFGPWLFEAALIANNLEGRRTSRGSAASVMGALPESVELPPGVRIERYWEGRASALGTLCRIFCSKKTGEDVLPAYLARFFISVGKGLKETKKEVLTSILSNSSSIFKLDLDGVNLLVPPFFSALEALILTTNEHREGLGMGSELRSSAIQLLLSLLPLPLHFLNVPIKDVLDNKNPNPTSSFIQLKPRLANLMITALQNETDSRNIQSLLGGLLVFITDIAAFEEIDKATFHHHNFHSGIESPTNYMASESTSIRSFSDYSNSFDEHLLLEGDGPIDSAHALFTRTTHLVCHRLISTWKTDLPVSLAALELLNGLAKIKIHDQDPLECGRVVRWICEFITFQCSRPPPAHSKDLHSSIVAAFSTVTTFLLSHPLLLPLHPHTLTTVLEVVEYGISGTKSQVKLKDEKDLKPVSLRVRDAAEALLAVIFEQVGRYTTATSSALDEFELLQMSQGEEDAGMKREEILNHFRYFVIDHNMLVSLLEEPLGNDQDPHPSVTMVLRGPTGRHAWTLQLRQHPRSKGKNGGAGTFGSGNPGRPLPMNDLGTRTEVQKKYFPDSAERITFCKADKAIPTLDSLSNSSDALEESRLSIILENQVRLEKSVENMIREEEDECYPNLKTEATPPTPPQDFQTARLLLSHLGLLNPLGSQEPFSASRLLGIDSRAPGFLSELEALDSTSSRTADTLHVFYVRAGQKRKEDILANVESDSTVDHHFLEFLLSLGHPVRIMEHSGWTGNISTSWNKQRRKPSPISKAAPSHGGHGGSLYNGESRILYYSDVTAEIAIIVPTKENGEVEARVIQPEMGKQSKLIDTKIFVVWLESFEDSFTFPKSELMASTKTGLERESGESNKQEPSLTIYIHALKTGLMRVKMEGESLRMGLATPLIDGMVVSRRTIGKVVRETAVNMARRKRLENDNFQPPHVRRKLKIQEMTTKFPLTLNPPEFYTHFFQDPSTFITNDAKVHHV